MAQFDVYENTNAKTKKLYPYLVDIQHTVVSDLTTRIVIPLGDFKQFKNQVMSRLSPEINFNGQKLVLLTPQLSSVPIGLLKKQAGSLHSFRDEIIASLDFAITGV